MKIKLKTISKRCPDGELYKFKNGKAAVPGLWIQGQKVLLSLKEFKELTATT